MREMEKAIGRGRMYLISIMIEDLWRKEKRVDFVFFFFLFAFEFAKPLEE